MAIEVKVPSAGESISEVEIAEWLKAEGDTVQADETLATLDTDKASVELIAPGGGVLSKILKQAHETAQPGDVIAIIEDGAGASPSGASTSNGSAQSGLSGVPAGVPADAPAAEWSEGAAKVADSTGEGGAAAGGEASVTQDEQPRQVRSGPKVPTSNASNAIDGGAPAETGGSTGGFVMPAAERILEQNHLDVASVVGSGPSHRVLKEDAQQAVARAAPQAHLQAQAPPQAQPPAKPLVQAPPQVLAVPQSAGEDEEIVPMTRLRQTIARHLVSAQQNAALLTTFNEIDMSAVMAMRKDLQESFTKKHEVKLGFMSFFIKASIDALKMFPGVNAEIRGSDIVYRNHYDIGVAIGGGRALVVPVLKRAERMSFAEIEKSIAEFAKRAKANTLKPADLMGGTFTITNGGVYGSLLSTPIVNAPQSGILGMHAIQERPIAKNGQVVIAPMMYVALTYDHRIVDGREAVGFLVRIKECIENPSRMLLEV